MSAGLMGILMSSLRMLWSQLGWRPRLNVALSTCTGIPSLAARSYMARNPAAILHNLPYFKFRLIVR